MPITVTPDNFVRAESDLYYGNIAKDDGFGKFNHFRDLGSLDHQLVVRQNRDTLYSAAVFDLEAGPVTVTLPDAGERFFSMQVITEDHYVPQVIYAAGSHKFTRDAIDARYVTLASRILVDPTDPGDLAAVHALQDAVAVQQANAGSFEVPDWDPVSQKAVRDPLVTLFATLPDTKRMFGTKDGVDLVRHLIGSAGHGAAIPRRRRCICR